MRHALYHCATTAVPYLVEEFVLVSRQHGTEIFGIVDVPRKLDMLSLVSESRMKTKLREIPIALKHCSTAHWFTMKLVSKDGPYSLS